jgi:hypothetical protein
MHGTSLMSDIFGGNKFRVCNVDTEIAIITECGSTITPLLMNLKIYDHEWLIIPMLYWTLSTVCGIAYLLPLFFNWLSLLQILSLWTSSIVLLYLKHSPLYILLIGPNCVVFT